MFKIGMTSRPATPSWSSCYSGTLGNMAAELLNRTSSTRRSRSYQDLLKAEPRTRICTWGWPRPTSSAPRRREGDARRADYLAAGNAYAKAGEISPTDPDLAFNAALSYQEAHEWVPCEAQARVALKIRPSDAQVLSMLAESLVEQKKFEEAIKSLHQAVLGDSKNKTLHRQLGSIYTKAGNNQKGTEELMVYLALQNGQPAADVAAQAKKAPAGSQAAKTLASAGVPEEIYPWTADGEN